MASDAEMRAASREIPTTQLQSDANCGLGSSSKKGGGGGGLLERSPRADG